VFLDIEGAFNNVTPTAITGALTELGIERPIVVPWVERNL